MQKKAAFTFIEVMIVIVIFSVGILTVLKLVTSNLKMMDTNNVKTQATLLAKEGIELVYNIRDSNIKKELSWNCLLNKDMYVRSSDELDDAVGRGDHNNFEEVLCGGYFGVNKNLQIGFDIDNYVYYNLSDKFDNFDDNYKNNRLYLNTGDVNYYVYDVEGTKTYFARYLSFEEVKEGDNILPIDKILKIESHVLYQKGGNTGEVVFESFIGDY